MKGLTPVSFRKGRAHEPRLSDPHVPGRTHPRYWTIEEEDVVRTYYPRGGPDACLARLSGRTRAGVYQTAKRLGVKSEGMPVVRRSHEYGPEMEARIRAEWPLLQGRGAVAALADRLDVPRWWLTKQATRLGLTLPHRKEPPWTAAEDELMRKVPLHDPESAARIFREHGFRRSPTAIVMRAKRLMLSRRTHETLSARAAARILGVDDKTVTAWCIAGELRAGRRGSQRLAQQGGDAWAIAPGDLRSFILASLDRIDLRKVDKFAFVALLAGDGHAAETPGPAPEAEEPGLRAANAALSAQVAALQTENGRLAAALAARPQPAPALSTRPRPTWRDRLAGKRRHA